MHKEDMSHKEIPDIEIMNDPEIISFLNNISSPDTELLEMIRELNKTIKEHESESHKLIKNTQSKIDKRLDQMAETVDAMKFQSEKLYGLLHSVCLSIKVILYITSIIYTLYMFFVK